MPPISFVPVHASLKCLSSIKCEAHVLPGDAERVERPET